METEKSSSDEVGSVPRSKVCVRSADYARMEKRNPDRLWEETLAAYELLVKQGFALPIRPGSKGGIMELTEKGERYLHSEEGKTEMEQEGSVRAVLWRFAYRKLTGTGFN